MSSVNINISIRKHSSLWSLMAISGRFSLISLCVYKHNPEYAFSLLWPFFWCMSTTPVFYYYFTVWAELLVYICPKFVVFVNIRLLSQDWAASDNVIYCFLSILTYSAVICYISFHYMFCWFLMRRFWSCAVSALSPQLHSYCLDFALCICFLKGIFVCPDFLMTRCGPDSV